MLTGLTHEQLFALYTSKWLKDEKTLKNEVFRNMFLDKIGKREERTFKISRIMKVNGHAFSRIFWNQIGDVFNRIKE